MKRSDFPKPFTTCLVDINSEGAYADRGMEKRCYPRLMPIPYRSIASSETSWVLEPWRKNMKLYPQLYFILSHDTVAKDEASCADCVLGIGMGLACSDDGIAMASPEPAVRDRFMCYWYSLYSDSAQLLGQNMAAGLNARDLKLTIESPTLGKVVFDQANLQFNPQELVQEMNIIVPMRKYDLICLGAADKPIDLPVDKKFQPGEVLTLSCPQLGEMKITVDDQRDPNAVIPTWHPREFFLEPGYTGDF